MFSGYYIDLAFGQNLFDSFTYDALDSLLSKHKVDQEPNIELIFGDFLAVVKVIGGILTGNAITGALAGFPNFDQVWIMAVQIMYTLGWVALWGYLVAGRIL